MTGGDDLGQVRVELMVRDAVALGDGELCGTNVHAAVELHGVGINDFAADPLCHRERQRRFSGACRAHDRDRSRHGTQTPTK